LDRHDRADLRRIRERLAPDAERCSACGERRAQSELFNHGSEWACADCCGGRGWARRSRDARIALVEGSRFFRPQQQEGQKRR
jgi:hypothetical protein